jgi:formate hydrogenlyase subunit 3/multisubunit Na+/H+ antiporter MnhD subunit
VSVGVAVVLPVLLLAALVAGGRAAALARRVSVWAPLVLLWPLLTGERADWPATLLGLGLGVDAVSAPLALLTAVAWSLAGWFGLASVRAEARGYWIGWAASLAGMTMTLLAQSLSAFYVGYVVVSLAAYLLVVQARDAAAWRAGRVYLVMALAGEAAVLSGVLVLAGHYGNVDLGLLAGPGLEAGRDAASVLLLAGFAVKLGIVPLHVWLPLAHPIAPVPASAVLSGVIVKAGLLGWLRLLPPGGLDAVPTGQALLTLGLVTAFAGVLLGLTQAKLKTVLAYSTVSQMGLVLVAYALLYLTPGSEAALPAAVGLFALHHGLNKAALFLACGCAPGASRLRMLLVALPALSLAAAPLTTGWLAKTWLKRGVDLGIELGTLPALGYGALTLTSAATALLMVRVWRLARETRDPGPALHPAWALATAAALTLPWAYAARAGLLVSPSPSGLWAATWPLIVAAAVAAVALRLGWRRVAVPEGDLVVLAERALAWRGWTGPKAAPLERRPRRGSRLSAAGARLAGLEARLRELPVVGLVTLLLSGLLWLALRLG